MKMRSENLLGSAASLINFGTFHSIFFKILRSRYRFTADNIVRYRTQSEIIREIIESENIELRESERNTADILSEISRVKTSVKGLDDHESDVMDSDDFRKFFNLYTDRMNSLKLIDFDDMLLRCNELFINNPVILKQWQEKFRFILIDEFQDIDRMQYETVKMLAGESKNLFVVGDDDQSIYGFRGAESSIMQDFLQDYKGAKLIRLSTNYRSSAAVVRAAGLVIKENSLRIDKDIRAFSDEEGKLELAEFEDRTEEYEALADYLKKERKPSECAVLLRTNSLAEIAAGELVERGIEVDHPEKIQGIYDSFLAKDILEYLKIANGDNSRTAIYRIMNKPYRFISRNSVGGKNFDFAEMKAYHADNIRTFSAVSKLENDMKILKDMRPFAAVHYILSGIGYLDHLKEYAKEKNIDYAELEAKAMEIREKAKYYRSFDEWLEKIEEYNANLKNKTEGKRSADAVKVMTLHASKGLEFEKVFILDLNEKIIPYKKAELPGEIEEERRLFYVGMTRAKKELHLWSIRDNYGKSMQKSQFIEVLL